MKAQTKVDSLLCSGTREYDLGELQPLSARNHGRSKTLKCYLLTLFILVLKGFCVLKRNASKSSFGSLVASHFKE